MGFISGLVALLRAAPVLERFVLLLGDRVREAKAKSRHEEKLAHIDAAMRGDGLPDAGGTRKRPKADRPRPVSKRKKRRT